jgi:hypothetical protein
LSTFRNIIVSNPSTIAMSICCPTPVRSRATIADNIPMTAFIPPPALSAIVLPGIIGGPSAAPVASRMPVNPW